MVAVIIIAGSQGESVGNLPGHEVLEIQVQDALK